MSKGPGRPHVPPEIARRSLQQKLRFKYLQNWYAAADLHGVGLYRHLGLEPPVNPQTLGSRPLPAAMSKKFDHLEKKTFSNRFATDVASRNKVASKPLGADLCEALGWVVAATYEAWPQPLTDAEFHDKRKQVANYLQFGYPQPAEIFLGIQKRHAEEMTDAHLERHATESECREFLRGEAVPEPSLVNAGATIERSCEEQIYKVINHGAPKVTLVTSAAGDGKSSLMYRLGVRLFKEGWRVLLKHERLEPVRLNWPLYDDRNPGTVLLVDRAEGLVGNLDALYAYAEENSGLRIVLFAREIDWNQRKFPLKSPTRRHTHIPLPTLDDDEIDALAKAMVHFRANAQPKTAEQIKTMLRRSIRESNYPHMLAAAMTASRGGSFADILRTLVEKFPEPNLLKWTALCSYMRAPSGEPLHASSYLMHALMCAPGELLDAGKDRFQTRLRPVSSEIITIHGSRYCLRHPDIAAFVLNCLYAPDASGVFMKANELSEDLSDIVRAALKAINAEGRNYNVWQPYIERILGFWWDLSSQYREPLGAMFKETMAFLGNTHPELRLKANLYQAWIRLEESLPDIAQTRIEERIDLYRTLTDTLVLALANAPPESNVHKALFDNCINFCAYLVEVNRLGPLDDPPPNTARALLRFLWDADDGRFRGWTILQHWIEMDKTPEGTGSLPEPGPYTIRALFQQLWNGGGKLNPTVIRLWVQNEVRCGNLGTEMKPYSARWLLHETWNQRAELCNSDLLVFWAALEASAAEDPQQRAPVVQRLFRKAWKTPDRLECFGARVMIDWATAEAEVGHFGDENTEFSARWIFRQAWENRPRLCNSELIVAWATTEVQATGDPLAARAVFQQLWDLDDRLSYLTPLVMAGWVDAEVNAKNLGDEHTPFSARWLLHYAWNSDSLFSPLVMQAWVLMERSVNANATSKAAIKASETGAAAARAVFQMAWNSRKRESAFNAELIINWANMENRAGNLGDAATAYSARWIFHQAWALSSSELPLCNCGVLLNWAVMEFKRGTVAIGDRLNPEECTLRWIFHESRKLAGSDRNANDNVMSEWVNVEIKFGNFGTMDTDSRNAFTARWLACCCRSTQVRISLLEKIDAAERLAQEVGPADTLRDSAESAPATTSCDDFS